MLENEIRKLKESLDLETQENEKSKKIIDNFRIEIEINREIKALIEEKRVLMLDKEGIYQEYQKLLKKIRSDNAFEISVFEQTIIGLEERINQLNSLKHS